MLTPQLVLPICLPYKIWVRFQNWIDFRNLIHLCIIRAQKVACKYLLKCNEAETMSSSHTGLREEANGIWEGPHCFLRSLLLSWWYWANPGWCALPWKMKVTDVFRNTRASSLFLWNAELVWEQTHSHCMNKQTFFQEKNVYLKDIWISLVPLFLLSLLKILYSLIYSTFLNFMHGCWLSFSDLGKPDLSADPPVPTPS